MTRPSRRGMFRPLPESASSTGVPDGGDATDWPTGVYTPEPVTVEESDGSPSVVVDTLKVDATDFTLVDNGDGSASLTADEPDNAAHLADATDAHDASAISVLDSGNHFTATNVEAALAELFTGSLTNPMTTQDDIIVGGVSGAPGRLGKGADGTVLTVDPTTHHLVWATPSSGFTNPMTTKGDLIVGDTGGSPIRKAIGTDTHVLTADAASTGGMKWAAPSGGGASYPASVEGLFAHYKADAITGKSNGDTLTEWRNSAPLTPGFDLVAIGGAPTYQTNVVNSLPVVRFGGTAYFGWNLPIMHTSKPWTLFVVHKLASLANAYTGLWGFGWVDQGGIFIKSNGKSAVYASSSVYDGTGAITYGTTNWNYTTAVFGQTCTTRRNGSADVTGATLGLNGGLLGSGYLGNQQVSSRIYSGDIAEVLLYARVLNSTEIAAVESYIAGKYAI